MIMMAIWSAYSMLFIGLFVRAISNRHEHVADVITMGIMMIASLVVLLLYVLGCDGKLDLNNPFSCSVEDLFLLLDSVKPGTGNWGMFIGQP